jgi:uncharacterized protein (DUF488 family)
MKKNPKSPKFSVVTFGYGNRKNHDDIIKVILDYQVTYLIDVRKKPKGWSSMWSASGLTNLCQQLGIQYWSKTELGNDSGNRSWIPPNAEKAEIALSEIQRLLPNNNILLLCAEKDPDRCHRVEVSERIKALCGGDLVHWV